VARIVVALAALGATLLAVSPAQGAVGTANQVTTRLPDIRTATFQSLFNEEEVCFDATIDLVAPAPGQVFAGGYISASITAGNTPVLSQDNCIKSQFSTTNQDLAKATYAHVLPNVVKLHNAAGNNIGDSAPNIGATTHNGTAGNTTGPDLSLTAPNTAQNQLGYVFDEKINTTGGPVCNDAAGTAEPGFGFYDSQGISHTDGTLVSCSNTSGGNGAVLIQFPPGTSPIGSAQRAWVNNGQVTSLAPSATVNTQLSVPVPVAGANGRSNDPDLTAVNLVSPSGNQLDFVYDENVANVAFAQFHAVLSNGFTFNGNAAAIVNGNTVRVSFTGMDTVTEYVVAGWNDGPGGTNNVTALQGSDDNAPAPPNGLPAGDNAGAFALGYSTGPDPLSATVDQAGGQITVKMDQRTLSAGNVGTLVDNNGLTGVNCTATQFGLNSAPTQPNVVFQCPQSDLANAVGLYLSGSPFGGATVTTFLTQSNVDQVIGIR